MLHRILEPELMDTAEDAVQYDAMDHSIVNAQFVTDLLLAVADWSLQRPVNASPQEAQLHVLDLGAGTAQIPIELARRSSNCQISAIDAAAFMLTLARTNVERAALEERIHLLLADAKRLPFSDGSFPIVISNSIVHHIGQPQTVLAEAIRVTENTGLLFHRDLARPNDEHQLRHLVDTYAGDATPYQRKLFADSLRAALNLDEVRALVTSFGFTPDTVQMTSDRHWTWSATKYS